MTIQDVKLLLEIDFCNRKVLECKIIDSFFDDPLIAIDTRTKMVGQCVGCSSNFQISLYGKANNDDGQICEKTEMDVVPSVIVKLEEDTTYIENKVFIEMPPIEMHPETPPEATSLSELQCQYCTKTLKNLQGLATHEVFCKDNPNRCKKGERAREKPKLEEPETPIECQYCHKTLKNKAGHVVHEKHCKFQRERLEKRPTVSEDIKIEDVSTSLPVVVPKPKRTRKSNSKFSGPNPHCSICKRVMGHWTSVRRHMQLVHERKINFTCEICGFGTYSQENLDLHKIKSHLDDPKPFVCDLCTTRNRFSSRSSILHHMRIHHLNEGKYICNMCSKKFLCKYSLESHIVTVHEGIRPYSCSHCDKTFKHAADVKVHRYKIHVPKERKPQMSCHFCDYVTHDKHSFTRHKVLHLDDVDKPFHCKFCNKGFPTLPNQVRHEKTHLDIRPFVCTFCEKAFRSKEDLKIHVRHHTGEKPYECEICGQKYGDRGCYRSHLIGHEKQLGITLDKSVKKFVSKPKLIE